MENTMMLKMLEPRWGESVLEIGCGTGIRLSSFLDMGMMVTALDPSPYMLDIAKKKTGNRVDYHRGFAENLPFDDNSFHYACLIKSLEFVEDPLKAIEEACRVAKYRVFIGSVNRHSAAGTLIRVNRLIKKNIFRYMHLFSIWEIRQLIRSLSIDVPITWRTLCQSSPSSSFVMRLLQNFSLVQRLPFGAFTAMMIILIPRFRVRPLELTYCPEPGDAFVGSA